MEMTSENLWHEIDRLGMENLKLKEEIKRLQGIAKAASCGRENRMRDHRQRSSAHKLKVPAHA